MNAELRERLMRSLIKHEGKRNLMYPDSEGVPTIGIGHNLRAKGITDAAVAQIFNDDVGDVERDIEREIPWVSALSLPRQMVVLEMAFNLGIGGLLGFTKFLEHLQAEQWELAAKEMLDSRWAKQVKERAPHLARQMLTDAWWFA